LNDWRLIHKTSGPPGGSWSRHVIPAGVAGMLLAAASIVHAAPPPVKLTEAAFRKAIEEPLTARFDQLDLATLVSTLEQERRLAFLMDRRIDPTRRVSWRTSGEPFLEVINDRLGATGVGARAVGSTIYVGPEEAAAKLRTLVALRMDELRGKGDAILKTRFKILRDGSPKWSEATEPSDLLKVLSDQWGIGIDSAELVPYDLWPAGGMHDVNFVEALSLLLIQFDLTFQWSGTAERVTIVPIPEKVLLTKLHAIPSAGRESLLNEIGGVLNSIEHTLERDRLIVRASIEEHERLEGALSGRRKPQASAKVKSAPVERRLFTLTAEKVPIRDALEALRDQGVDVQYDAAEFERAKIDLDRRIDLKLNKAPAATFLSLLCDPIGVEYEMEGTTVRLRVKRR
jgi:hypothetical protein